MKLQVVRGLRCAFFSGFSVSKFVYLCARRVCFRVSPRDGERARPEGPTPRVESPVYMLPPVHARGAFTNG